MPLMAFRMVALRLPFLPGHPTLYPTGWWEKRQQAEEYPRSDSASRVVRSAKPRILISEDATMHQQESVHDGDCASRQNRETDCDPFHGVRPRQNRPTPTRTCTVFNPGFGFASPAFEICKYRSSTLQLYFAPSRCVPSAAAEVKFTVFV